MPLYNSRVADFLKFIIDGEEAKILVCYTKCIFFTLGLKLKGLMFFVERFCRLRNRIT